MNPLLQLKKATPAILVVFACYELGPTTQALLPPPAPAGGDPRGNAVEGTNALLNLTMGGNNTAIGFQALYSNTFGDENTSAGYPPPQNNTAGVKEKFHPSKG